MMSYSGFDSTVELNQRELTSSLPHELWVSVLCTVKPQIRNINNNVLHCRTKMFLHLLSNSCL